MKYDDADWHYGSEDFAEGLPTENGGTHIGMFLAWVITRHLESESLHELSEEALDDVRQRRITGREFLLQHCDEKLIADDLSEEGNAFAQRYYESNEYLKDYARVLGLTIKNMYEVADSWENFDLIAPVIDDRFRRWKERERSPWWRVWR